MKLFEEFKEYETMWDTPLKEAFVKTFEDEYYDLTDKDQLKKFIDLLAKREYKTLPLSTSRRSIVHSLMIQFKQEHSDYPKVIENLEDLLFSKDFLGEDFTEQRYKVIMVVDDEEYVYGTYDSRDRANEVAMTVRDERDVETYVEEE